MISGGQLTLIAKRRVEVKKKVNWPPEISWFWLQLTSQHWEGYPRGHLSFVSFEVWGKNLSFGPLQWEEGWRSNKDQNSKFFPYTSKLTKLKWALGYPSQCWLVSWGQNQLISGGQFTFFLTSTLLFAIKVNWPPEISWFWLQLTSQHWEGYPRGHLSFVSFEV